MLALYKVREHSSLAKLHMDSLFSHNWRGCIKTIFLRFLDLVLLVFELLLVISTGNKLLVKVKIEHLLFIYSRSCRWYLAIILETICTLILSNAQKMHALSFRHSGGSLSLRVLLPRGLLP